MFRLSRAAEYGLRGLLYMAHKPEGKKSYIEEIARAQDVPKAYLAKIFQSLCKKGFIKSYRGSEGGFSFIRPSGEISLLEAIEAIEGPVHLNECLIHEGYCDNDSSCPIHEVWRAAQENFLKLLTTVSFADLAESAKKNKSVFDKLGVARAAST